MIWSHRFVWLNENIIYALNFLTRHAREEGAGLIFKFVTSRHGDQFLHVSMSLVPGTDDEPGSGFLLMALDITERIKADSRRDVFLQSITIGLQSAMTQIRSSIQSMMADPRFNKDALLADGEIIDQSSTAVLDLMSHVAKQHANRLDDQVESEYILGDDLIKVLHHNIVEKFSIEVDIEVEQELWLNISSY